MRRISSLIFSCILALAVDGQPLLSGFADPTGTSNPFVSQIAYSPMFNRIVVTGSFTSFTPGPNANNIVLVDSNGGLSPIDSGIPETTAASFEMDSALWVLSDNGLWKYTTANGFQQTTFHSNGGNQALFYGGGGNLILIINSTTLDSGTYIVRFHPSDESVDTVGLQLPTRYYVVDNFVSTVQVGSSTYFTWNTGTNQGYLYRYDTLTQTLSLVPNAPVMLYGRILTYSPKTKTLYFFGDLAAGDNRYLCAMDSNGVWTQKLWFDADADGMFATNDGKLYISGGFSRIDTAHISYNAILDEATSTFQKWNTGLNFEMTQGYFFPNNNLIASTPFTLVKSVDTTTGITAVALNFQLSVFPNPSNGLINLSIASQENCEMQVCVIDMLGQKIYSEQSYIAAGNGIQTINLTGAAKGIYTLEMTVGNTVVNKKVEID
jgi:hypothetical protein